MNAPVILSIDQGTSGSKAILFSADGKILSSHTQDYDISHPSPGYVEINPDTLIQSVYTAVGAAIDGYEKTGGSRNDIRCLGISNQRESFLLWDKKGIPLSNVIVWQCKRSADFCTELSLNAEFTDMIRRRTGLVVDPYFSGTKASVLVAEDEQIRKRINQNDAFFGTIDSWLIWRFTNGSIHATDHTNASRTMLFDINTLKWDTEIIEKFGLTGLKMPEVKHSDAGFGQTDLKGLLKKPIPIAAVIGDSHAAAFGEGLFRPGEAKVTLGTGSSILMNVGPNRIESSNGMVSTICWSSGDRIDYALEGIIVSCGSTINWLKNKLNLISSSREIDELAESVADTEGVYLIPGFSGIGAPWWKLDAKASIVGLDFGHDKRHIARAALESIPFQVADVLSAMTADFGEKLSAIKADGGITVSDFVMETLAALLQCPVEIPRMKDASAWGAALLAGLNGGIYNDLQAIDRTIKSQETRTIPPGVDSKLIEQYEGWRVILKDY